MYRDLTNAELIKELKNSLKFRHYGASEFKRKDLFQSYYNALMALIELRDENVLLENLKDNKTIKDKFVDFEVYNKTKKKSNTVDREITLFRRLGILKKAYGSIELGHVGNFLMKENLKGSIKKLEIFSIANLLTIEGNNNGDPLFVEFLKFVRDKKPNESEALNFIANKDWNIASNLVSEVIRRDDESLKQTMWMLFRFGSGTPNGSGKDEDQKRNELFDNIFHFLVSENTKFEVYENLLKQYLDFHTHELNSDKFFKALLIPKIPNEKGKAITKKSITENSKKWFKIFNPSTQLVLFHIIKKKSDYNNLNKNTLDASNLFRTFRTDKSEEICFNESYINIIEKILSHGKLTPKNYSNIESLASELKIGEKNDFDDSYFNNSPVNEAELITLLKMDKNLIAKIPREVIERIFGQINRATIFEYLSILGLYSLIKNKNDFKGFLSCLKMSLYSDNLPRHHAGAGTPDAIILLNGKMIIIEPTLVYKGVEKHEANIPKHIRKSNADFAILIVPELNEDTIDWIWQTSSPRSFGKKGQIIIPLTNLNIANHLEKDKKESMNIYIDEMLEALTTRNVDLFQKTIRRMFVKLKLVSKNKK